MIFPRFDGQGGARDPTQAVEIVDALGRQHEERMRPESEQSEAECDEGRAVRPLNQHAVFRRDAGFAQATREPINAAIERGEAHLAPVIGQSDPVTRSPDMLATAASVNAAALREERLALIEGDAGTLPFREASFDRVFCLNGFFFFPEPAVAIAEMARVSRAGGSVAILTTPKQWAGDANWLVRPLVGRMRSHEPEALSGWAAEAGLRTIRIETVTRSGYLQIFEKAARPATHHPEAT